MWDCLKQKNLDFINLSFCGLCTFLWWRLNKYSDLVWWRWPFLSTGRVCRWWHRNPLHGGGSRLLHPGCEQWEEEEWHCALPAAGWRENSCVHAVNLDYKNMFACPRKDFLFIPMYLFWIWLHQFETNILRWKHSCSRATLKVSSVCGFIFKHRTKGERSVKPSCLNLRRLTATTMSLNEAALSTRELSGHKPECDALKFQNKRSPNTTSF